MPDPETPNTQSSQAPAASAEALSGSVTTGPASPSTAAPVVETPVLSPPVDLHIAELSRQAEELAQHQRSVFDRTREEWREQFKKDPELGGNRQQTTINAALGFMRHYASNESHFNRLIEAGEVTGWNDHPDFIRLMANAAQGLASLYREPAPVVPMSPAAPPQDRYTRRYGGTGPR